MQINLFFYVFLFLSFLSCSTLKKKHTNNLQKSLSTNDIAVLDLAVTLQKIVGKEVWGDFSEFTTSVVYFTNDAQFLLTSSTTTPAEYQIINTRGPMWSQKVYSTSNWYAPDGTNFPQKEIDEAYLANAFSSLQTQEHFKYSVFFIDSIERFHFKNMNWDVDDWIAIFWHEVFHNYQDSLYNPELIKDNFTNYSNIKTFVQSEKFLKKIKAELKIITLALKTENPIFKRKLICKKLIPLKLKRYKEMPENSVASEQFYEISEGTARYVEEIMSLAAGRFLSSEEQKNNYSLYNFKSFKKYANRNLNYYYESIQDISTENPYYYNSGFGLTLLLDQIQPQWKKSAFQEKGFLFTQVKNWCEI